MRVTVVIEDELVEEARKLTGARTKRELVNLALRELIRSRNRELLRSELGTFKLRLTPDELKRARGAD